MENKNTNQTQVFYNGITKLTLLKLDLEHDIALFFTDRTTYTNDYIVANGVHIMEDNVSWNYGNYFGTNKLKAELHYLENTISKLKNKTNSFAIQSESLNQQMKDIKLSLELPYENLTNSKSSRESLTQLVKHKEKYVEDYNKFEELINIADGKSISYEKYSRNDNSKINSKNIDDMALEL